MDNKARMKKIEQHEREMVDLRSVLRNFKSNLKDNITYDKWMENYSNGVIVDYIKTEPIYHPNLALLFSGEEEVYFLSDQGTILDRNLFKAYYLKGIMKGLKAYRDELHLAPNKRLGNDFERWCATIRGFYCSDDIFISEFHFESDDKFKGCRFVKDFFPNKISLWGMEWIGYWSSLTRVIEELIVDVPELRNSIKIDNKQKEESYKLSGFDDIVIKNIHELSHSRLLPQTIKDFYINLSKDGIIPFGGHHNGNNEFYILRENYYALTSMLRQGILFDENLNQLKHGDLKPYLNEYGNGFLKGYVEYETNLRNQNSIFSFSDEQLAYKIFSKVYEPSIKKGGFTFFNQSIVGREEMIKEKYGVDHHFIVRNDYFFNNGIEGGEYYKAWEIIMSNPNVFTSYFIDVQSDLNIIDPKEAVGKGQDLEITNDFIKSTIEEYLEDFKPNMDEANYSLLVDCLKHYFDNGKFQELSESIKFKSSPGVKKLGWALKCLYHDVNGTILKLPKALSVDYLIFAKENISIYKDVQFDKSNPTRSTLHKYFHNKT